MVARLCHRLRNRNPAPSTCQAWEDGEQTKDIPIERVIGSHSLRSSHSQYLLQMPDLIAHALLKQEEPSLRVKRLGIARAFGILAPSTAGLADETRRASSAVKDREALYSHCPDNRP